MSSLNKKCIFCHYWSNINHAGTVKEGPKVYAMCAFYAVCMENFKIMS